MCIKVSIQLNKYPEGSGLEYISRKTRINVILNHVIIIFSKEKISFFCARLLLDVDICIDCPILKL